MATTPDFNFEAYCFCRFVGHKLRSIQKYTSHFEAFECKTCKKQFTLDVTGKMVALTPLLKEINETLGAFYAKRRTQKPDGLNS